MDWTMPGLFLTGLAIVAGISTYRKPERRMLKFFKLIIDFSLAFLGLTPILVPLHIGFAIASLVFTGIGFIALIFASIMERRLTNTHS